MATLTLADDTGSYDWTWEHLDDQQMIEWTDAQYTEYIRDSFEYGVENHAPDADLDEELEQALIQFREARDEAAQRLGLQPEVFSTGRGYSSAGLSLVTWVSKAERLHYTTVRAGAAWSFSGTFYHRGQIAPEEMPDDLPTHFWGKTHWRGYHLPDGKNLYIGYVAGDESRFDSYKFVIR